MENLSFFTTQKTKGLYVIFQPESEPESEGVKKREIKPTDYSFFGIPKTIKVTCPRHEGGELGCLKKLKEKITREAEGGPFSGVLVIIEKNQKRKSVPSQWVIVASFVFLLENKR